MSGPNATGDNLVKDDSLLDAKSPTELSSFVDAGDSADGDSADGYSVNGNSADNDSAGGNSTAGARRTGGNALKSDECILPESAAVNSQNFTENRPVGAATEPDESFIDNLAIYLSEEDRCICDFVRLDDKLISVPLGNLFFEFVI